MLQTNEISAVARYLPGRKLSTSLLEPSDGEETDSSDADDGDRQEDEEKQLFVFGAVTGAASNGGKRSTGAGELFSQLYCGVRVRVVVFVHVTR
jgi:hypothetical protein